jgi:hypothetical protein
MIEYKLKNADGSPINLDNFEKTHESIREAFPGMPIEVKNFERSKRLTVGYNGHTFHAYYGRNDTQIFIPKEYDSVIKNTLDGKGLKCL